jgi:C_GCAxxG_C_C family probable redox protein
MAKWCKNHGPQAEAVIAQIKKRAGNLYQTRQMLCAEAVVVTLNKAFMGGLSDTQAVAVAAPFSMALGDSGCLCGALSGAVLACGLLVENDQPYPKGERMRKNARQLHDAFKAANGATCCRVLSRSVRHDQQARFQHCAHLTSGAAEMAARLILYQRPELIRCTQNEFLKKTDTRIGAMVTRLFRILRLKRSVTGEMRLPRTTGN